MGLGRKGSIVNRDQEGTSVQHYPPCSMPEFGPLARGGVCMLAQTRDMVWRDST